MPSASTKPEQKAPLEATDPLNKAISVVEKKVRNLEKRKGKLDSYKQKQDQGETLNKDQQEAIDRYEVVTQSLEFARELQKSFVSIFTDTEKLVKKQRKHDIVRKSQDTSASVKEVLQLQGLLEMMGSERAREDFKNGKHGAVELTEENLTQFDELYKLVNPSRESEETSYLEQLNNAADHITNLLEAKDKEVVGTTYKDLRQLCCKVYECSYFAKPPAEEAEEEEAEETPEEEVTATEEVPPADVNGTVEEFVPEEITQQPEPVQLQTVPVVPAVTEVTGLEENHLTNPDPTAEQYEDSFFSTGPPFRQRPFNEIVSSVQGSFNFLQESHLDMESPHMDPAVVAAHPMAATLQQHTETYQSSRLMGEDSQQPQTTGTSQNQISAATPTEQTLTDQSTLSAYDTASVTPSQNNTYASVAESQSLDSAYVNQDYSQNLMSHTLQSNVAGLHAVEQSLGQQMSHPTMAQTVAGAMTGTSADSGPPAAIPMPTSQQGLDQSSEMTGGQDSYSQAVNDSQEKKGFLNANAAVFQSMYSQPSQGQMSDEKMQREYQNSGMYNNSGFARGRGGQRGGGSRGGPRGGSNMSNGFSRGGSRGSSFNGRGSYSNGRGNGRGAYQGYPPRSDYRPDGYQGFNNGFGGFNKRGGGQARGAMRGGAQRGANTRGGTRGGFGNSQRINTSPPQATQAAA